MINKTDDIGTTNNESVVAIMCPCTDQECDKFYFPLSLVKVPVIITFNCKKNTGDENSHDVFNINRLLVHKVVRCSRQPQARRLVGNTVHRLPHHLSKLLRW